jgi:hypothetical protein
MREVALEVERRIFRELVSGDVVEFLRTRKAQNQNKQHQQSLAAKVLMSSSLGFEASISSIHLPLLPSSSIHHLLVVSTIP